MASPGRQPSHTLVELAFGIYCAATLGVALLTRSYASVPFVTLFCTGFLYVGITSLQEARRARSQRAEGGEQAPSTHSSPKPQSMLS